MVWHFPSWCGCTHYLLALMLAGATMDRTETQTCYSVFLLLSTWISKQACVSPWISYILLCLRVQGLRLFSSNDPITWIHLQILKSYWRLLFTAIWCLYLCHRKKNCSNRIVSKFRLIHLRHGQLHSLTRPGVSLKDLESLYLVLSLSLSPYA